MRGITDNPYAQPEEVNKYRMSMLRPDYREILKTLNDTREEGAPEVRSVYEVVHIIAKRARQIVDASEKTKVLGPNDTVIYVKERTVLKPIRQAIIEITDGDISLTKPEASTIRQT